MNLYNNYRVNNVKLTINVINKNSDDALALVIHPTYSTSPSFSYTNAKALPYAKNITINPIGSGTNNKSVNCAHNIKKLLSIYNGTINPDYAYGTYTAYNNNPSYETFYALSLYRPDETNGLIRAEIRFDMTLDAVLSARRNLTES